MIKFTDRALHLISKYRLGKIIQWILENNTSQALPYHNFEHSLYVMINAHECWTYEKGEMDYDAIRALLIAALFHDYNHSGGFFQNDAGNIKQATEGVMTLSFDDEFGKLRQDIKTHLYAEGVCGIFHGILIEKTKYPHEPLDDLCEGVELYYSINCLADRRRIFTKQEYTLMVNCLRDADLMQNCNETLINNLVGIKHESFKHMTWEEYYKGSIKFLRGIKYKTKYGKTVGKPALKDAIYRLDKFGKLVFGGKK